MNETLPADTSFYLIKIEAFKIGNSESAPHFTIVAGPSPETKQIGEQKKEMAERHVQRIEFWGQLLERLKNELPVYKNISPNKDNWIGTTLGKNGLGYNFVIKMDESRVELYIDTRDGERNKRIFDACYNMREHIEEEFGGKLEWQRLDNKRASRIYFPISGGLLQKEQWLNLQSIMIDAMKRLQRVLHPVMKNL